MTHPANHSGLENRRGGNSTVGSNPTSSATLLFNFSSLWVAASTAFGSRGLLMKRCALSRLAPGGPWRLPLVASQGRWKA